jgi:hypothetical protein
MNKMKNGKSLNKGDIVQIINERNRWFPCLVIVNEIKDFGIQGYITLPTNDEEANGNAFIRLNSEDITKVGCAELFLD